VVPVILHSSFILRATAARLWSETTLPIKWIAARVQIGTAKGAKSVLHHLAQSQDQRKTARALEPCAQLEFQSTVRAAPHNGWPLSAAQRFLIAAIEWTQLPRCRLRRRFILMVCLRSGKCARSLGRPTNPIRYRCRA
jgi:hypothetical protein